MTDSETVDSQEILDEIYSIRDDVTWSFQVAYCRGLDYKGEPDHHNFMAYSDDILGSKFVTGFASVIEEYEPDNVELSTTSRHPHLTIGFKPERVSNAPPEPEGKFDTLDVHARENECVRCSRSTPSAYQSLTIRRDKSSDNKWDTNWEHEDINLCTDCSPAHYDDMTRLINAVCVEDGKVVAVDYADGEIKSIEEADFDRVLTDAMVRILEREILD